MTRIRVILRRLNLSGIYVLIIHYNSFNVNVSKFRCSWRISSDHNIELLKLKKQSLLAFTFYILNYILNKIFIYAFSYTALNEKLIRKWNFSILPFEQNHNFSCWKAIIDKEISIISKPNYICISKTNFFWLPLLQHPRVHLFAAVRLHLSHII